MCEEITTKTCVEAKNRKAVIGAAQSQQGPPSMSSFPLKRKGDDAPVLTRKPGSGSFVASLSSFHSVPFAPSHWFFCPFSHLLIYAFPVFSHWVGFPVLLTISMLRTCLPYGSGHSFSSLCHKGHRQWWPQDSEGTWHLSPGNDNWSPFHCHWHKQNSATNRRGLGGDRQSF